MSMTTPDFYHHVVCIYQCTVYIPICAVEDTLVVVVNVYYPAISKPRRNANGLGPRPRPIMFDRPGGRPSFVESRHRS
jgi:hypothetical protein